MSVLLLYTWMMVFLRGLGLMLLLPTLGNRPLPVMVRVSGAAMLATLLYGIVPGVTELPRGYPELGMNAAREVVLGLVLGFVGRFVFAAVEVGARLLTQEIGLMAAPGIDSPSPASEPVAAFIVAFAGVMFFLFGAHLGALSAFAHTFQLTHAGSAAFSPLAAEHLVAGTSRVLELGVRIAAPFMAMNFLTTLAFSVLGRAVPRMQVFVLSYPLRIVLGLLLLAGAGMLIARYLRPEFEQLPLRLLELVAS